MSKLEKALEDIANGAREVAINKFGLDVESVRRLMAACSAVSSNITDLTLEECSLHAEAAKVIASSLRSNSVLTELILGCNEDIGLRGAQAFGEVLCVNTALILLWLDRCGVGDEGAGHLALSLQRNQTLEHLCLDANGITFVGAVSISTALPFNKTLISLDLESNPLGDDGVEALRKLFLVLACACCCYWR
jgi:Ran GTPase-activating protein (RanGAP) involved in mRNA processing and transport